MSTQARDQGTPVEGGAVILRRLDDAAYPEPELAADEAWWHDVVTSTDGSDVEWMAAEDPLFILYTSGSAFAASFPFCLISIRGFWTYRSTRGPFVAPRFERCPVASPTPSDAPSRRYGRAQGHRPRDGRLHGRRGPLVPDGLRRADARGRRLVLYCG